MITIKDFLVNEKHKKKMSDCGYVPSRSNIMYLLKLPEFEDTYIKRDFGKERIFLIENIFFLKLKERAKHFESRMRPFSKQSKNIFQIGKTNLSGTASMCRDLKGDCSKCHYSHYESITNCQTYNYVKVLEENGTTFNPPKLNLNLNKYLYLIGKTNKLNL